MNVETGAADALSRELAAEETGRIVVGVDGSAPSKAALRWAAGMAALTGWQLDVVMTWQPAMTFGWEVGVGNIDWQGDTEKALTAIVDDLFGPHRPHYLRTFALMGDAAHKLIEHSGGARMLVVGNRGLGGFLGLLLGSVSSKCAAHATCPVLVVHVDDPSPTVIAVRASSGVAR